MGLRIRAPANALSTGTLVSLETVAPILMDISVELDLQFHGGNGHGAIFQRYLVGNIYRYAVCMLMCVVSHVRSSFRCPERIHHTHRVPVLPRDRWSFARRCACTLGIASFSDTHLQS